MDVVHRPASLRLTGPSFRSRPGHARAALRVLAVAIESAPVLAAPGLVRGELGVVGHHHLGQADSHPRLHRQFGALPEFVLLPEPRLAQVVQAAHGRERTRCTSAAPRAFGHPRGLSVGAPHEVA